MDDLIVSWSQPEDLLVERDGGDPLGLRMLAEREARELSPVLPQVANRTRGFGLLCLGLQLSRHGEAPPDAFLRLERLWVLAHVQQTGPPYWFAGSQIAAHELKSDRYSLERALLRHQVSQGIWGSFNRAGRLLGLVQARRGGGPGAAVLTSTGAMLAKRTRTAIAPNLGFGDLVAVIGLRHVADEDLDQIDGEGAPSAGEVDELSAALQRFDAPRGAPYANLRRVFDDAGAALELDLLRPRLELLSPEQERAATRAFALEWLISRVELPYRLWLNGGADALDTSGIADASARLRDERHVTGLCRLVAEKGMAGVHEHQRLIAAEREAPPIERESVVAEGAVPDFGLSAPEALFREGVMHG